MKKDRAAAVRFAHLFGRKRGKGEMRPCDPPYQYGRNWKKTELRPYILLIYTAAKREKAECGRVSCLTDTAAIEKNRVAAVRFAHLFGREREKGGMRPYTFLNDTAAIEKRQSCGRNRYGRK